jgi:SAM-dependent methyltransferase
MTAKDEESAATRWRVFRNTHLQAPLSLFRSVITDRDYDEVLDESAPPVRRPVHRVLKRSLWFWPRIDAARGWAQAQEGAAWGPENYLHTHRTRLITKVLDVVPRDASLLELGCNCGSDMDQLRAAGYTRLKGMDAGGGAIRVFAREYPETFALADIQRDLFQRYLLNTPSRSVDYVYSNGATIELVHPSFPVVKEICRVASKGVLLDLNERGHGFPRDYVGQFARFGFPLTYTDRETDPHPSSHIFVFMRASA